MSVLAAFVQPASAAALHAALEDRLTELDLRWRAGAIHDRGCERGRDARPVIVSDLRDLRESVFCICLRGSVPGTLVYLAGRVDPLGDWSRTAADHGVLYARQRMLGPASWLCPFGELTCCESAQITPVEAAHHAVLHDVIAGSANAAGERLVLVHSASFPAGPGPSAEVEADLAFAGPLRTSRNLLLFALTGRDAGRATAHLRRAVELPAEAADPAVWEVFVRLTESADLPAAQLRVHAPDLLRAAVAVLAPAQT